MKYIVQASPLEHTKNKLIVIKVTDENGKDYDLGSINLAYLPLYVSDIIGTTVESIVKSVQTFDNWQLVGYSEIDTDVYELVFELPQIGRWEYLTAHFVDGHFLKVDTPRWQEAFKAPHTLAIDGYLNFVGKYRWELISLENSKAVFKRSI